MPKPPAATPALPQEHAGTDKHREQGESHSQWKANQHIWSHCMPDSRHALCCSSPISTSMAQFQICPQCSHSACCASTTQHTEREAGEPQPSAVSPGQAGAQGIPMKSLQQPSGSCWSMEEFLLGHKAPTVCVVCTPEHTPAAGGLQPISQPDTGLDRTDLVPRRESGPAWI